MKYIEKFRILDDYCSEELQEAVLRQLAIEAVDLPDDLLGAL